MESPEILLARAEKLQSQSTPIQPLPPLNTHRADALMEQARVLEETGDLSGAITVLDRVRKAPSHVGIALCEKGRLQRLRGERPDAVWTFKRALHHIENDDKVAWIYAQMGQLHFAMREDEEATYYFRRAIAMDARFAYLLERTVTTDADIDLHELVTADIDITTLQ